MKKIAKQVAVANLVLSNDAPLVLIAGPCQMESRDHAFECAGALIEICRKADVGLIYKTSFDKANRTSVGGQRGIGFAKALEVFAELREALNVPLLTDVHTEAQCEPASRVVDVLQIPAFLCRQTDLLLAAGKSRAVVNIKKGQFLAPWDIGNVAAKVESTGNERILLTERGASFGYNTLVSDLRSLPIMAQTGFPVVFDATHSVQQPGGLGSSSGGDRTMVPVLARAAAAVGVAAIFAETHPDPDRAPSDGSNMLPMAFMASFLGSIKAYDCLRKADTSACMQII